MLPRRPPPLCFPFTFCLSHYFLLIRFLPNCRTIYEREIASLFSAPLVLSHSCTSLFLNWRTPGSMSSIWMPTWGFCKIFFGQLRTVKILQKTTTTRQKTTLTRQKTTLTQQKATLTRQKTMIAQMSTTIREMATIRTRKDTCSTYHRAYV